MADDSTAIPAATPRLVRDFRTVPASLMPTPTESHDGPHEREINMAPMTTAVESTFNPMLAITMEKTRIQRLNPRNSMSF